MIRGKVSAVSFEPSVHHLDWIDGTYRVGVAARNVPDLTIGDDVVVLPAAEHAALVAVAGQRAIPPGLALCYVEGACAWFTSQPVNSQWGDDWNDAPYECNAGTPYEHREVHGSDKQPWTLFKIRFDVNLFSTPADDGACLSVQDINMGQVPWLSHGRAWLFAGATPAEFIEFVQAAGGQVYLPIGEDA